MCDYSLMHHASRPAVAGETLETGIFSNSITKGLCSADAPDVAVCVLPGTELGFAEDIREESVVPFFAKNHHARVAKFVQVDMDNPYKHHDAIELVDGTRVLLNHLVPGQKVKVISLPARPQTAKEAKEQERAAFV